MGHYNVEEICELAGTCILSVLLKFIDKNNFGLYCDGGLTFWKNTHGEKMNVIKKLVTKTFKNVGFKIKIKTNLKTVDYLDLTLNLNNGTYSPYKKPKDKILQINTLTNHPLQLLRINERPSKKSSNKDIKRQWFRIDKTDVSKANKKTKNRHQNIIWWNPPFNKYGSTNKAKWFLNMIDNYFPINSTRFLTEKV